MSVNEGTVSAWRTRKPFDSVGLVCTCGQAVAGIEGVAATCKGCGSVYIISVFRFDSSRAVEKAAIRGSDKG